jgi:hypothetical protein
LAKEPSSGRATGPRRPKAKRKGVTIDLSAEDVSKGGTEKDPVPGVAKKPAQSASTEARSPKPEPSRSTSEPVKAGPLQADAARNETVKGRSAKRQPVGGKAPDVRAKAADEPAKSGASGAGKSAETKSKPARPAQSTVPPAARAPQKSSTAPMIVAAFAGGIFALGSAMVLDRLEVISIFGANSGIAGLQAQIIGVKVETVGQIADLQAQIEALPPTGGVAAGGAAVTGEKITRIEAVLTELGARITKAEQREAPSDLGKRLTALETAVQAGAAGPDAGLAAIEQKLAGVEEAIAGVQDMAGNAASTAAAAVKPEIDRLDATDDDLAGRVKTLEGGISRLVDTQTVTALGARVEQLASAVEKDVSPQSIAALKSALAAESLAAAVAAGSPFVAELDILQSGADGGPDLTKIAPYAAEGLPDAAALAAEFEALAPSLSPPEPEQPVVPESAGLVDRLLASARNVVEVREAGLAAGGELKRQTGAILQALNGNNFEAARTIWQSLPVEARQASAGWAAKLEARLAADAFAGTLRAEALSRLAAVGAGDGQ